MCMWSYKELPFRTLDEKGDRRTVSCRDKSWKAWFKKSRDIEQEPLPGYNGQLGHISTDAHEEGDVFVSDHSQGGDFLPELGRFLFTFRVENVNHHFTMPATSAKKKKL